MDPAFERELLHIVGERHVLTEPDEVAGAVVDWTGRFRGHTTAVVRPGSVDEVAAVVETCAAAGVALVPQGGNTGLAGGSVPLAGEVVVSLRRLTAVGEVDRTAGQVTAGAGATLAAVQAAARDKGWDYGVDLSARDSATVGGMVATNAGGMRVLRHGATRAQLLGVEAVLGDGSVVAHFGGVLKDNTGYDLGALLCGSEGTLGIVTKTRLRLVPRNDASVVALLAFESVGAAVSGAAALRWALPSLDAAELFLPDGLALVRHVFDLPAPFPARAGSEAFLLVECSAAGIDPTAALAHALDSVAGVVANAVAGPHDPARQRELWRYREAHTEAINTLGPPHKLDVAVPIDRLVELVDRAPAAVELVAPGARTWLFGHAADGNVHVNVTGVDPGDWRVDNEVLQLVAELGGSISAEHGIGTAKKQWLYLNRSESEIAAFRRIKAALDPAGILNPNVLLP